MVFKRDKHKGFEIEYEILDDGTFYGRVDGIGAGYCNISKGSGWPTFEEAQREIRNKIELFLDPSITSYEELAEKITGSLVWDGYEECHVDVNILKVLVESFNEYKSRGKRE